jgi:hypothetical protein
VPPGTSIHSRDISSEHERSSWRCEPGLFIPTSVLSFHQANTWLVYADLTAQLFILQLSVTVGVLLAYVLGLFFPWRILALIGNVAKP